VIYVVTRQRGAGWQDALPLSAQRDWSEHAACMDALHDEGFLLLAGTLEHGALLIVDAERAARHHQHRGLGDPARRDRR
jgi:hypothetical protein